MAAATLNGEEYSVFLCRNERQLISRYNIITKILDRNPAFKEQTKVAVEGESCAIIVSSDRKHRYVPHNIYKHNNAKEKILTVNSMISSLGPNKNAHIVANKKSMELINYIANWILS